MQTIYEPKGKAKEYGDLALNIYTGCTHGCIYCYAPTMLRRDRETFHSCVEPRRNIVEETKKRLAKGDIQGKLIHLCFTCDPYPADVNTTTTREIIKTIKDSGNHIQILSKGGKRALRDFDLLDSNDWFGITISGHAGNMKEHEPQAAGYTDRLFTLAVAANRDIKTWVSFEPVYDERTVYDAIKGIDYINRYKIGKLNYATSDINWSDFGRECERLCIEHNRDYMIKDGLRAEMQKTLTAGTRG